MSIRTRRIIAAIAITLAGLGFAGASAAAATGAAATPAPNVLMHT